MLKTQTLDHLTPADHLQKTDHLPKYCSNKTTCSTALISADEHLLTKGRMQ